MACQDDLQPGCAVSSWLRGVEALTTQLLLVPHNNVLMHLSLCTHRAISWPFITLELPRQVRICVRVRVCVCARYNPIAN